MLGLYLIFRNQKVDIIEKKKTINNLTDENNKDEEKKEDKIKNKEFKLEIILGLLSLLPIIILISLFIIRFFCTNDLIIIILATIGLITILGSHFYIFPVLILAAISFSSTFEKAKNKEYESKGKMLISFVISTISLIIWISLMILFVT